GVDPSKVQVDKVENPEAVLESGNLSLTGSVVMAITGEGLADLTSQMADTIKIDTSSISPSMNIAYNTGVSNNSKVILQNVSKVADKAITIGSGVYSVYVDSTKYNGLALGGAIAIDLSTLYAITAVDKELTNLAKDVNIPVYAVKIGSGVTAYLVDNKL